MTAVASWQQTSLVDDLLTTIESDPSSVDARKLLIEQYESLGWEDAAVGEARSVIELFPNSSGATELLNHYGSKVTEMPKTNNKVPKIPSKTKAATDGLELDALQLRRDYISLQGDASSLLRELSVLADLAPGIDCADRLAELTAISEGRIFSAARGRCGKSTSFGKEGAVRSARAVAASMKAERKHALNIALADLEAVIERSPSKVKTTQDKDALRDTLRRRGDAVRSGLPNELAYIMSDALMHIEHERLSRTYKNAETMLGDPVADIPRLDFWVSEDGYAWDMEELAQAIQANKGAMRNPLTKESFTPDDVAAIIRHPKGACLAALEIEQTQLKRGVRKETITRLRTLSTTLLDDMSENSLPSHTAIDDFLLYIATLPKAEQEAIEKLRVPAVDSHTGLAFDDTVGDAVRDAKGNRICFHKAGDLFGQAGRWLAGG